MESSGSVIASHLIFFNPYPWKHMGTHSNQMWYINIIKPQCTWRETAGLHLMEILVTLISGISLSRIGKTRENLVYIIA